MVFQVSRHGGILQPVSVEPVTLLDTSSSSSSSSVAAAAAGMIDVDWMTYIRPARDRHEQNVELIPDLHHAGALRSVICKTKSPTVARIADRTGCQWTSRSSKVDYFLSYLKGRMPLFISD